MIRRLRLPNGLAVTLIHQPDASDAAALLQVAAGSHDEPENWPGLAHLLEHMVFTGSQRWPDQSRLMSWIQANGGRVNATTLARRSAYFFEIPADRFAEGVVRLQDMLLAPLLKKEAIRQETTVIDAEYRLLQQHAPAQAEAALLSRVAGPQAFQRFQIGCAETFGDDPAALQKTLRDFHHRFYVANNMQLWLQGPQPLAVLAQLAQAFATLPQGKARPAVRMPDFLAENSVQLRCSGPAKYAHSWLIRRNLCDNVTLLREFLLDEAPGSLMATLRERGAASELEFTWLYQDDRCGWLVAMFTSNQPEVVCALLRQALDALSQTTSVQQQHYLQLAQQRFSALSPLDQLRQHILGFVPAETHAFQPFLAALKAAPSSRLVCSPDVQGKKIFTQGFGLVLAPWQAQRDSETEPAALTFYPLKTRLTTSVVPLRTLPLLHLTPGKTPATLILRPEFFSNYPAESGIVVGKQLRPLFATLRHLGGGGEWDEVQGVWQLTLRLPENEPLADWALEQVIHELSATVLETEQQSTESIAIRQLLKMLPRQLALSDTPTCWRAALAGGSKSLHQRIARRLAMFLLPVNPLSRTERLSSRCGVTRIEHPGSDKALLLFIPLDDGQQLAALRALTLIYEPRFFQRLRVEQQIGYVVSSRYLRCMDQDGVMFALQSPDLSVTRLLQHCKTFLRSLESEIAALEMAPLKAQLQVNSRDAALIALRAENGLFDLTQASIDALSRKEVQQLHTRLMKKRRRWRVLFIDGCQP